MLWTIVKGSLLLSGTLPIRVVTKKIPLPNFGGGIIKSIKPLFIRGGVKG
jgi:hypothetical protein